MNGLKLSSAYHPKLHCRICDFDRTTSQAVWCVLEKLKYFKKTTAKQNSFARLCLKYCCALKKKLYLHFVHYSSNSEVKCAYCFWWRNWKLLRLIKVESTFHSKISSTKTNQRQHFVQLDENQPDPTSFPSLTTCMNDSAAAIDEVASNALFMNWFLMTD